MRSSTIALAWLAALSVASVNSPAGAGEQETAAGRRLPKVVANDNRIAAGSLRDGVLTLRLVAATALWQPEGQGDADPARTIQAFAEEGRQPLVPGPLVRVPEGTLIRLSVRNDLPAALRLHGAMTRPCKDDDFSEIAPGATGAFEFKAGKPGTYFYWGSTTPGSIVARRGVDTTLTGAFIVDGTGHRSDPDEQTFVIIDFVGQLKPTGVRPVSFTINGRSWPYTERQTLAFGKAVTWRVINGSFGLHPMHLHGTFFTVESLGTYARDTLYESDARRLVTTEPLAPGATMTMRWVPDRVGKWMFHCHVLSHVSHDLRRGDDPAPTQHSGSGSNAGSSSSHHDVERSMAGLVIGITVLPGDETAAPDLEPHEYRPVRMVMKTVPNRYGADRGFTIGIVDPDAPMSKPKPPASPSMLQPTEGDPLALRLPSPSPTLVLTKGEPVRITLVNEMAEETSIHWHGIELESLNDGVAGWSGDGTQITKPVPAGGSLDVWFTPPRAGTFIYHTHGHDKHQLSSGLYGAVVVLPHRKSFNPAVDKVILIGGSGPDSISATLFAPFEVNRSTNPPPMIIHAGTTYRFRLINISPNAAANVTLAGPKGPVQWRAVAKDGADLPPSQATVRSARQQVTVGETYDFEYQPEGPMELRLDVARRLQPVVTAMAVVVAPQQP